MTRRRGMTLIEMLVVLAILSTLMAIGAGGYIMSSRRYREQGAAAQIEVTIRQARNDALFSGAPAFVEFDTSRPAPNPPRLIPWGYRLVSMFHFEGGAKETSGGRGNRAFVNNCAVAEGKIGQAVATGWLKGAQGVIGYVECLANPEYDCEDGGMLEAYVYLEWPSPTGFQYVFHKPDSYALYLDKDGLLCGRVGMTAVREETFVVPMRRWTKVGMAWDKSSIRLLVDDAIVVVGKGAQTPINDHPLYIGAPDSSVLGRIDEARILAVVKGQPFELPPGSVLTHNAAPWSAAFFTPDGSLDIRYHPAPITVELTLEGKRHPIYLSMLGTTHRGEVEKAKTQADLAAEAAAKNPPPQPPQTILPPRGMLPFKLPVSPPPDPSKTTSSGNGPAATGGPKSRETPESKPPAEVPSASEPRTGAPAGQPAGGGAQ